MTGEELKQQIALYESADHTVHLDVKVDEDTVWLNRQQLASCCLAGTCSPACTMGSTCF